MPKSTFPNYRWIKFKIDYIDDPDFMGLTDGALSLLMKLYLLAGKADAGGLLCNESKVFSETDIAWRLRVLPEVLPVLLAELVQAGLVTQDGESYAITRFMDEQGPGDNEQRARWRQRQKEHRERARKDSEKNPETREEEEVKGHEDVTVTSSSSSSASVSFLDPEILSDHHILEAWYEATGMRLPKKHQADLILVVEENRDAGPVLERLLDCWNFWRDLAKEKGWGAINPDAVIELYPLPQLEARMERENWFYKNSEHERARRQRLIDFGLLDSKEIEQVEQPALATQPVYELEDEVPF